MVDITRLILLLVVLPILAIYIVVRVTSAVLAAMCMLALGLSRLGFR